MGCWYLLRILLGEMAPGFSELVFLAHGARLRPMLKERRLAPSRSPMFIFMGLGERMADGAMLPFFIAVLAMPPAEFY